MRARKPANESRADGPDGASGPESGVVLMYRKSILALKIATGVGVARTPVHYHLAIAAKQDPGQGNPLAPVTTWLTVAGRRILEDIAEFHEAKGRVPVHKRSTLELN